MPLVNAALLAATALHLAGGARRVGAGPARPDAQPPAADRLVAHWRLWLRALLAGGRAAAVLGGLVLAGRPADTRALWAGGGWFAQLALIAGVWVLLGPAWTAASRHLRPAIRPPEGEAR